MSSNNARYDERKTRKDILMKNDASSLRSRRQQRIEARSASSNATDAQTYKFTQETKEAPAPEAVPEVLVANVLDPRKISKTAEITLHLYNENSSDPHWLVCAGGLPVAQIRLSDQEDSDKIAKIFVSEQFGNSIRESAKKLDMATLLSGVNARPFVASVESSEVFQSVKEAMASDSKEQLRKAKANLRGDMINMLNMVVTAQTKNFITANELKDSMYRKMRDSGIESERAVAIIEAAWQEKAASYFEDTFNQASKWMDMSPEAFVELKEKIMEVPNRTPVVEASVRQEDALIPKEASNIPLLTTFVEEQKLASSDEKSAMREKLGLRSRLVNKQMASR